MKQSNSQNSSVPTQPPPYEWVRWIPAVVLGLVTLVLLLIGCSIILIPLLISLALSYLLAPIVVWFEKRGWTRSTAVLLTLTAATLTFMLALLFVVPNLWEQFSTSYAHAKDLFNDERIVQFTNKLHQISPRASEAVKNAFDVARNQFSQMGVKWLQSGFLQLVNLTSSLLDSLLIPFFVYYLLIDSRIMMSHLERLVPPRFRATAASLINQSSDILSTYVRSQLLIGFVMGALYALGFAVLRVPMAITLGILSGLLNFIPYLGTLTGLALSFAFLALDGAGFPRLSGIFIVFAVVQTIEGYYLTPKLLGNKLNLHPLWVIIGLVIGGSLFGLLGIILAVPIIAIAKVLLGFLEEIYQESQFYRRTGTELLTDGGIPIDLGETQNQPPANHRLILPNSTNTPRLIITTTEIATRLQESAKTANESIDEESSDSANQNS